MDLLYLLYGASVSVLRLAAALTAIAFLLGS